MAPTCPWRLEYYLISFTTHNGFRLLFSKNACAVNHKHFMLDCFSEICDYFNCCLIHENRTRKELLEPKLYVKYHVWQAYSISS